MRFLVADCEPAAARESRRALVGRSMGETVADLLAELFPGVEVEHACPADPDRPTPDVADLRTRDAVLLTGSPIHVYDGSPQPEAAIAFMRDVFESGTPSWGSCAGLQLAAAAAGGEVRPMPDGCREAGVTRRISRTEQGRDHPLLAGRAPVWDALTIHSDEVAALPPGSVPLARSGETAVQAAEIRMGPGVFWGVQYHPELPLDEVAAALRRDAGELVEAGLARTPAEVGIQAALLDALAAEPARRDLRWRLGVDAELAERDRRVIEVRNFVEHLVKPAREARGRS